MELTTTGTSAPESTRGKGENSEKETLPPFNLEGGGRRPLRFSLAEFLSASNSKPKLGAYRDLGRGYFNNGRANLVEMAVGRGQNRHIEIYNLVYSSLYSPFAKKVSRRTAHGL